MPVQLIRAILKATAASVATITLTAVSSLHADEQKTPSQGNIRKAAEAGGASGVASRQVGVGKDIEAPVNWTNDWTEFVKELTKEVTRGNYFAGNVNTAFLGKSVEWTGAVKEIKRPTASDPKSSLIRVSMKAEELGLYSGKVILDQIVLNPATKEWDTWKSVSVGDRVVFRTTLDGGLFPPECVLTKMDGMGVNAGKTVAWINTKGGVLVMTASAQTTTKEWQDKATRKYPDLGVQGSELNKRFVKAYTERQKSNPRFFSNPDWPMTLADELAPVEAPVENANAGNGALGLAEASKKSPQVPPILQGDWLIPSRPRGIHGGYQMPDNPPTTIRITAESLSHRMPKQAGMLGGWDETGQAIKWVKDGDGKEYMETAPFACVVDTKPHPWTIDLSIRKDGKLIEKKGILQIKDDTLSLSVGEAGQPRPTSFDGAEVATRVTQPTSAQGIRVNPSPLPTKGQELMNSGSLLEKVDVNRDAVKGQWTKEGNELKASASPDVRLELPCSPKGEYDFVIEFTIQSGSPDVGQILTAGGRDFEWKLGCAAGRPNWFGFERVNGWLFVNAHNPTTTVLPWNLEIGHRYTSIVKVRKNGLVALVDGQVVTKWDTDYHDMSLNRNECMLHKEGMLGLFCYNCDVVFHRAEVVEVGDNTEIPAAPRITPQKAAERTPVKGIAMPSPPPMKGKPLLGYLPRHRSLGQGPSGAGFLNWCASEAEAPKLTSLIPLFVRRTQGSADVLNISAGIATVHLDPHKTHDIHFGLAVEGRMQVFPRLKFLAINGDQDYLAVEVTYWINISGQPKKFTESYSIAIRRGSEPILDFVGFKDSRGSVVSMDLGVHKKERLESSEFMTLSIKVTDAKGVVVYAGEWNSPDVKQKR